MKRKSVLLLCLMLVLGLAGCAGTFKTNAYKTLAASAAVYENGYPAFLELYQKGIITADQKAKGKELATKYWAAYHAAADALIAYDAVANTENKERVAVAIAEAQKGLANLSSYIQPFLSKEVK